ncbi:MAG: hypothetical protein RIT45_3166, partial [Pseudomonadota bacterium]
GALCAGGQPAACDDGDACTTDACSALVGCQSKPVANGTPCDDGDACTTGDACGNNGCAGSGDCDDGNPCTADVCAQDTGCQHFPTTDPCDDGDPCTKGEACSGGACVSGPKNPFCCEKDADCDDGDGCSIDSCDGGGCKRTALPCAADANVCTLERCLGSGCSSANPGAALVTLYSANFDDGTTPGLYVSTSNPDVTWQPSKKRSLSPPASLYMGNLQTGNYDFGITQADILLRPITMPPQGTAILRGAVFLDVSNNSCNADKLQVFVDDVLQSGQVCSSSTAFVQQSWSLAAFAGKTVTIRIRFDSVDAANNNREGAYIDDLRVEWTADGALNCDDGDACTTGETCQVDASCGGGKTAVCDDGSDCTVDSCDAATGACVFAPKPIYINDFSNGLGGIAVQSSNPQISWQPDSKRSTSAPTAAYLGNIAANGQYSYNFGLTNASMTLPETAIPASASKAWVRMQVYFDSGDPFPNCNAISDSLTLTGGGKTLQRCGDTNGFVTMELDLSSAIGTTVQPALAFFANPLFNNGEGVWVDDVEIGWTCAP